MNPRAVEVVEMLQLADLGCFPRCQGENHTTADPASRYMNTLCTNVDDIVQSLYYKPIASSAIGYLSSAPGLGLSASSPISIAISTGKVNL